MSALPTARDVRRWAEGLDGVGRRLARHFVRSEPRRRAVADVRGLLCDAERKDGWPLAEQAGDETPYGVPHLLGRADWDGDRVRDDLIADVHGHLADAQGVLIVDETGFLKTGARSAGVQRQSSGTAGRVESCQVGAFLAFAGRKGPAVLDRELDLPTEWAGDPDRREAAHIPPEVKFATRPPLAERRLERAWRAGVKAAWVTGDAVDGSGAHFRRSLERHGPPYVLAVGADQRLWVGLQQVRVDRIAAGLPAMVWREASAGAGSQGPRWYDWAVAPFGPVDERGWRLWLLVRRHRERPEERAYDLCRGPVATPRRELIRAAGARWPVEGCFERAQGDCGRDEYEVRSWVGWDRHVTLSLVALAMLAVIRSRAEARPAPRGKGGRG